MLSDFFRINMPYGMEKNGNGEWMFFNREYMPLGWNTKRPDTELPKYPFSELPIHTKYLRLGDKTLLTLAHHPENGISRNDEGDIVKVWFYNDVTNPLNSLEYWPLYFEKIKLLSK